MIPESMVKCLNEDSLFSPALELLLETLCGAERFLFSNVVCRATETKTLCFRRRWGWCGAAERFVGRNVVCRATLVRPGYDGVPKQRLSVPAGVRICRSLGFVSQRVFLCVYSPETEVRCMHVDMLLRQVAG